MALQSSKDNLNRCIWLTEAHRRVALFLGSWGEARPRSFPPAGDRQVQMEGQWGGPGGPDGPFLSGFRNAKLFPQNRLTGKLSSTSIMQFSHQNHRLCLKRNKNKLNLKCFSATTPSSREWASDTFSGFEVDDQKQRVKAASSQDTRRATGAYKQPAQFSGVSA